MDILFLIVGIGIGGVIAWLFLSRSGIKTASQFEERIRMLETENDRLKDEVRTENQQLMQARVDLAAKEKELELFNVKLSEQKQEMESLREKFNLEFKNLANEILDEKSKKFTEQNRLNLDQILKPFHDKLRDFEKKVEETYDKESKERFSLAREVKSLSELNQQISREANALTKALKGESKTQGNWGEVILERILETSGLQKNREYFVQESFVSDEGKRLQPDFVIQYPGERSIIIDSKVTLTAYERYVVADDEVEKELQIKAHLLAVKNHINDLASKNYQDLYDIKTLDFVMMFLPVEPAYLLAIHSDPELWNYAYSKRILLISPTNLIAALKLIENMWNQEYQNRNVMAIAEQGGALYDSFVMLYDSLVKLKKRHDEVSDLYSDAVKRIYEGKGNLVRRVENLKTLGVKTKKTLPDSLLQKALENDERPLANEDDK